MKINDDAAIRQTLELTKANLENVDAFIDESVVIDFMNAVYSFLSAKKTDSE